MLERVGNLLATECDVLVVTTNGFVTPAGKAVMGRGIAKQIRAMLPDIPFVLGSKIKREGNNVHVLRNEPDEPALISFPVKPDYVVYDGSNVVSHARHQYQLGQKVAGFHAVADTNVMEKSLWQLKELLDDADDVSTVLLPRIGCGAGELDWYSIKPALQEHLSDKYIVMTYPVELPIKGQYGAKDQAKANICNKYIGFGVAGSSTDNYRIAYGKEANTGEYHQDIVFVSVNGGGREVPLEMYKEQLILAKENDCTIVCDNEYHRNRSYNTGERLIYALLMELGFTQTGSTDNYSVFN